MSVSAEKRSLEDLWPQVSPLLDQALDLDLIKTKRGLAAALHSGNSAYQALPNYFLTQLTPPLKNLLDAAMAAGAIRINVEAGELLLAAARLATPASEGDVVQARRMVALLVDGLRFGAGEGHRDEETETRG